MKKVFFIATLIIAFTVSTAFKTTHTNFEKTEFAVESDYCDGWEDGYCEGWKDVKGQLALCPLTPLCPLPKLECSEGYKCGYNRGFKAGMKAARE